VGSGPPKAILLLSPIYGDRAESRLLYIGTQVPLSVFVRDEEKSRMKPTGERECDGCCERRLGRGLHDWHVLASGLKSRAALLYE
jgi:hypothetical protein